MLREQGYSFYVFIDGQLVRNAVQFRVTASGPDLEGIVTIVPPSFMVDSHTREVLSGGIVQIFVWIDDVDDYVLLAEGIIRGFTLKKIRGQLMLDIVFTSSFSILNRFIVLYHELFSTIANKEIINTAPDLGFSLFSIRTKLKKKLSNGENPVNIISEIIPRGDSRLSKLIRQFAGKEVSAIESPSMLISQIPKEWANYVDHSHDYFGWLVGDYAFLERIIDLYSGVSIINRLLGNKLWFDVTLGRTQALRGFISAYQIFQMLLRELRASLWSVVFPPSINIRGRRFPVLFTLLPQYIFGIPVQENIIDAGDVGDFVLKENFDTAATHYIALSRPRVMGADLGWSDLKGYSIVDESLKYSSKAYANRAENSFLSYSVWGGPVPIINTNDPLGDLKASSDAEQKKVLMSVMKHELMMRHLGIIQNSFTIHPRMILPGFPGGVTGNPKIFFVPYTVSILGVENQIDMAVSPGMSFAIPEDTSSLDPSPLIKGSTPEERQKTLAQKMQRVATISKDLIDKKNSISQALNTAPTVDWSTRIKLNEFGNLNGDSLEPQKGFAHYKKNIYFKLRAKFIELMNQEFLKEGERF